MNREGPETPTADDREFHASRVESYKCQDCNSFTRFPRYNHPVKLFETRMGRCGEWANAFTSICVALGYDARKVLDWTDHVWTEIFIESEQRWVHVDSCEPLYDQPLTYEKGWSKELTYCIAFSHKEMVDVTKRYVVDPILNKMRRDKVNEGWLNDTIRAKRESLWEMQGPEQALILKQRFEKEMQDLDKPRHFQSRTYLPRQSGSL